MNRFEWKDCLFGVAAVLLIGVSVATAAENSGEVQSQSKISATEGGFGGVLEHGDSFGASITDVGDVNDDGLSDVLVGAPGDDAGGGADRGAIWVLLTAEDSGVIEERKISSVDGGFFGQLRDGDAFGSSVTALGDLDGDGAGELCVGAVGDDDGSPNAGSIWTLFLNPGGTVRTQQKISSIAGGFGGALNTDDRFGAALAGLGDLDGDSIPDVVVGAPGDDDGGTNRGAIWILFLHANGTVKGHQKISSDSGGPGLALENGDSFGGAIAFIEDLDGDSVPELAVGATRDRDGGIDRGAVWILFLNPDGTVKQSQKISSLEGGFAGQIPDGARFGSGLARLGDINGDSVPDLAIGAERDSEDGTNRGACWILFLNSDGRVNGHQKISSSEGAFAGPLADGDFFGAGLGSTKPTSHSNAAELWVGARGDDDGGGDRGALWVLKLEGESVSSVPDQEKLTITQNISPNPARVQAKIMLQIRRESFVDAYVVDALGRRVATLRSGRLAAGTHRLDWNLRDQDGEQVVNGVYFVQTWVNREGHVRRITVLH